jgi:hypothetical protein
MSGLVFTRSGTPEPPYLYRLVMATGSVEVHEVVVARFGVCLTCSLAP